MGITLHKNKTFWKYLFSGITVLAFIGLYVWNLDTFAGRLAKPEFVAASQHLHLSQIPFVDAPYGILQSVSMKLLGVSAVSIRLPSVLIGLLSVSLFFVLIKQLTNRRMAVLATAMFATMSWLLHVSRLGDSTVMNALWPVVILLIAYKVYKHHMKWYWYLTAGTILGLACYTPRMIYFVVFTLLIGAAVFHRYEASMHRGGALGGLGLLALVSAPLLYGMVSQPDTARQILALPETLPTVSTLLNTALVSAKSIISFAELPAYLSLQTLPLVDIATLAFALLGLLVIFTDIRAPRGWLLLAMLACSLAMVIVLPIAVVNVYIVLPLISILAGIGLFTLWSHWRERFPHNTAARSVALISLGLVVALSVSYHLERYYWAWSRVPETNAAFTANADQVL